jgi:membrane glycosyltransferase
MSIPAHDDARSGSVRAQAKEDTRAMTDATAAAKILPIPGPAREDGLTPAGLQSLPVLRRRRMTVALLNVLTMAALASGMHGVFVSGGWTAAEMVILGCFLVGAPWTVMGLWNAVIGLWLLRGPGLRAACPVMNDGDGDEPLQLRIAVVMCLRNEDPDRALARLTEVRRSIDETGQGAAFEVFALSDTDHPAIAAAEEAAFHALRPVLGAGAVYRRRAANEGWKAGNIRDFLRRWGAATTCSCRSTATA